ncbi:uncharacterized protein METZ01_LOCUS64992 [marine metagenome]|uniref:S1 motif domain-containing protein n=1 Tax=marine metagenome TaxID=408172 RepID=A0A381T975_9ZZZZ
MYEIEHRDIVFEIKITLRELTNIDETIDINIKKIVGKNYKNNYGYLKNINFIQDIETTNIVKNDFSGDIICKVFLNASFINPKVGEIIDCTVKENNNINIAVYDILKIVIIDKNLNLNIGDKVKIKILAKQMKYNKNYINIVGCINNKIN